MLRELSVNWASSPLTIAGRAGNGVGKRHAEVDGIRVRLTSVTRSQSASISSARTAARLERMPCPISARCVKMVMSPLSGLMATNAAERDTVVMKFESFEVRLGRKSESGVIVGAEHQRSSAHTEVTEKVPAGDSEDARS